MLQNGGDAGMRTVSAWEKAAAIWVAGEAVPDRRALLTMVNEALSRAGCPPWSGLEAECFAAGEDALVLARPARTRRAFFFPELESLLAGALAGPDAESSLFAAAGGYLLMLEADAPWPGLYEWGEERDLPPGWEDHGREQGLCLAEGTACADLRRFFSPP